MMHLNRTMAIILRQFYLMRGSISRIVGLFVWVAIDIVLWGFLSTYLNGVAGPRFNFVGTLLGAVLLWDFFVRVMFGVTMGFFEDVWARNFLNLFATPLSIAEYLTGLVVSSIATSSAGLILMLLLATSVFGLSFFAFGLMLIPFLLVLFLLGIAFGIAGCAIVLRFGPSAEWYIWPIPALVSPFAGVFYPLSTLPPWMQFVGRLLPPSYVFETMRGMLAGERPSPAALGWAVCLALIYIALACWFFAATHRRAIRTGLIARYSAETIG